MSSRNLRFSVNSLVVISSTTFRNVSRSMPQSSQAVVHFIPAERGALYSSASSPKPAPGYNSLRTLPLIITSSTPDSSRFSYTPHIYLGLLLLKIKKVNASSPCLKMNWFSSTSHENIFEMMFSLRKIRHASWLVKIVGVLQFLLGEVEEEEVVLEANENQVLIFFSNFLV